VASPVGKTAIFNKAIVLLGSRESLLSPDETIPSAQSLSALWDIARRSALALHPWNFAIVREKLQRDEKPPAFGYAYRYAIPPTCLRWLPWDSDDPYYFDGEEEGGFFLTDAEEVYVRYIGDHDELAKWNPLFVDVLAHTLAHEYCEAKTGLKGLRQSIADDRDELLRAARKADGLATGRRARRRSVGSSRWAGARYRNGVLGR